VTGQAKRTIRRSPTRSRARCAVSLKGWFPLAVPYQLDFACQSRAGRSSRTPTRTAPMRRRSSSSMRGRDCRRCGTSSPLSSAHQRRAFTSARFSPHARTKHLGRLRTVNLSFFSALSLRVEVKPRHEPRPPGRLAAGLLSELAATRHLPHLRRARVGRAPRDRRFTAMVWVRKVGSRCKSDDFVSRTKLCAPGVSQTHAVEERVSVRRRES
jgi:hypothetical protein